MKDQVNYFMLPGIPRRPKVTPIETLKINTANFFNITVEELVSSCRKRLLVEARFFLFHYGHKKQHHTLSALARSTGGRDHATVIHGVNTIEGLAQMDDHYKALMEKFTIWMDGQKN